MTVVAPEVPPQMFREGIGVVVEGTFDKSQTFTSHPADGEPLQRVPAAQAGRRAGRWKTTVWLRPRRPDEFPSGYGLVLGALLAAAFGAVVGIEGGLRTGGRAEVVRRAVTGFFSACWART